MLQRKSSLLLSLAVLTLALLTGLPAAHAAPAPALKAGVAKLDITPKDLTGLVGIVPRPYGGIRDRLYTRALVLDNGLTRAAIVALDLVEMGNTTQLRQRIQQELGIPAANIIVNASHDHNAPRGGPPTPGTSSAQGRPYSTPEYVQQVDETILAALRQAQAALQPVRVGFGTGAVDVNIARYGYTVERGWRENTNEEGFADKTLSVVKFETPAGAPIALLFNYAVHSNSMTGEPANLINGDISGSAEKFIEHQFQDKVVALWSMGAAADQYPKFNWDMGLLDDKTSPYEPGEMQGSMIGGEVMKVLKRIATFDTAPALYANGRAVPCEMNVQKIAPAGPPRPSQAVLKQLLPAPSPGDKLDIHLSLIRIGPLAITGVSGEVGSQIFQHLKRESPFVRNLMITLSNDRDGYIPDDAGWDHQGSGQAFVRGCAEKAIVGNLLEMMNESLR